MRTPFAERLSRHAADPSAPPALVLPGGEVSYAELHRRVEHAAAWLRAEGCGENDVLGITVADEVAHLVVSLGALVLGLPQASLPTYEPAPSRQKLAATLGVTRIVAVDPGHALPGIGASFAAPSSLAQPRAVPLQQALRADPQATALFIASSGSTGEPKIIAMSVDVLARRQELRGYPPRERLLVLSSIEDIFAKSSRLNAAWLGVTALFRSPATAHAPVGAFCATHGVTRLPVSVLHATSLARDAGATLPPGLGLFASGARVPMRLREAFRATGRARLHVEYGAREAGLIAATYPDDPDPSLESVGPVAAHAKVEVVDADGRVLPAGEIGEVRVRTAYMVDGYHRDPAATARHFRDGWFHPGDLGSFSPGGSLCLHGRADDVMNLRGIKIYPSEIERVLESDPTVRTAAAFALRSDLYGDIPAAAVEWQGEARPDASALLARARAALGARAPRRIVVVDALPRNPNGKVARLALPDLVREAR